MTDKQPALKEQWIKANLLVKMAMHA